MSIPQNFRTSLRLTQASLQQEASKRKHRHSQLPKYKHLSSFVDNPVVSNLLVWRPNPPQSWAARRWRGVRAVWRQTCRRSNNPHFFLHLPFHMLHPKVPAAAGQHRVEARQLHRVARCQEGGERDCAEGRQGGKERRCWWWCHGGIPYIFSS